MSFWDNLGSSIKSGVQDYFGEGGKPWQGLLGAGLSLYGMNRMANPSIDQGYLSSLNQQLAPLQASADKFGELAMQYEDPNSEMNQRMRDEIRSQDLDAFIDVANRQRSMATGEFGDMSNEAINKASLTDAMSAALANYSKGATQRQSTANQLYGQQSQLSNALAQAMLQNQLLAGQQAQVMPSYLAQTGMGLFQGAFPSAD